MRGKDRCLLRSCESLGITPAYAGKSGYWCNRCGCWRDHPRLCGEKMTFSTMTRSAGGSPPPMRGKAQLTMLALCAIRITPAYAGKSRSVVYRDAGAGRITPAYAGKSPAQSCQKTSFGGSPPPMRGKENPHQKRLLAGGITPAYAGKRTKKIPKQRYFFHQPASFSFSLQYT